MRKLLLGVSVIVILLFVGCASMELAYVFNPEISEDQMSFLWVPNYVVVKEFDGKEVKWVAPALSTAPIRVGLPSGEFTFVIDTLVGDRNLAGIPTINNKYYTKEFEAGKSYQLILRNGEIIVLDL